MASQKCGKPQAAGPAASLKSRSSGTAELASGFTPAIDLGQASLDEIDACLEATEALMRARAKRDMALRSWRLNLQLARDALAIKEAAS
jgi:hypothetical protein